MADKSTPLITEALARALAEPTGAPLHGPRSARGLFGSTASGRAAAQHCKNAGYLHVLRTATRGKATQEICTVTDKGVQYLVDQLNPRQVLESCLRAIDQRGPEIAELITIARRSQQALDSMKAHVEKALTELKRPSLPTAIVHGTNGTHKVSSSAQAWHTFALAYLREWQRQHTNDDCSLAELYRHVCQRAALSPGQFHDGLRTLHDEGHIYLHPWTGPLYEIPDPSLALLTGHAVVFYVSLREPNIG